MAPSLVPSSPLALHSAPARYLAALACLVALTCSVESQPVDLRRHCPEPEPRNTSAGKTTGLVVPVARDLQFEFRNKRTYVFSVMELHADHYGLCQLAKQARRLHPSGRLRILEIGANVGQTTVMLSRLFPNATIVTFEPVPRNYQRLLGNLRRNNVRVRTGSPPPVALPVVAEGAEGVWAYNCALTADRRTLRIMEDPLSDQASSAFSRHKRRLVPVRVPSVTPDDVLRAHGFATETGAANYLLKIDCEGCEWETFPAFRSGAPFGHIAGEVHPYYTPKALPVQRSQEVVQGMCCQPGREWGHAVDNCDLVPKMVGHEFLAKLRTSCPQQQQQAPTKGKQYNARAAMREFIRNKTRSYLCPDLGV